jgi:hypothetical protein
LVILLPLRGKRSGCFFRLRIEARKGEKEAFFKAAEPPLGCVAREEANPVNYKPKGEFAEYHFVVSRFFPSLSFGYPFVRFAEEAKEAEEAKQGGEAGRRESSFFRYKCLFLLLY